MTGIAGEAAVGNDVKIQIDLDSIEMASSK